MKKGDIVKTTAIGSKGKIARVLHAEKEEPRMLLVTDADYVFLARPNVFHWLTADCVLVEERDPPEQNIKREPEKIEPIIKLTRVSDEKQTWPREYKQEDY